MRPTDRIIDEQRRIKVIPGKRVEFFDHHFETEDPELIEWLHGHYQRGHKFDEITPKDEKLIQLAKKTVGPKIVTGAIDGNTAIDSNEIDKIISADLGKVEVPTRPTDTVAISPELVRVIDERINAALSVIVDLLKKDEVKEEKVMTGKSTKSFSCPYCGEPQPSGFAVGKHKKVCEKRPK
jgi:hypothetical protein